MADVTIKYKYSTIAEMSASGSKTLATSGKYCEGDVVVAYVAKEQGVLNAKRWDVTIETGVPETSGGTTVYFVKNDAWLKEHRSDPTLTIAVIPKFTIQLAEGKSSAQGLYLQSNMTMIADPSGTGFNSISSYVNANSVVARNRSYPLTTSNNLGDICVTASGGLYALALENSPVAVGDYTVIAFIA